MDRGMVALARRRARRVPVLGVLAATSMVVAGGIPMTLLDFHISGTQIGDVEPSVILPAQNCSVCHAAIDPPNDPFDTWQGSLMANAGRDPLFFAQLATANQDVDNVGYYCLRCHVPLSFVSGHAHDATGQTLNNYDRDGVTCHLCHSMVDPVYVAGVSPVQDIPILQALESVPDYYGNAMFVLDTNGLRRGPYTDGHPMHPWVYSPFVKSGDMCGTCHDVGNLAVARQPDGAYRYNNLNEPCADEDPWEQFPLERTYTEWKLSAFADGGVDMGGRFGGTGSTVVSTCQDCHMPKASGYGCVNGDVREDLARHDFAGASAWVLEITKLHYAGDPAMDPAALDVGIAKAIDMLQRSASLEIHQECGAVRVRVINESGHKIPTGHIEGRRIWVNVRVFDQADQLVREYGHYDDDEAELDDASTEVYEMHVGLSESAASATGYPPGVTTHMALADTIEKDTRIPPRGFNNAAYSAAGAPAVGSVYADNQYWDDTDFWIPDSAARVEVVVNYQTVTRHYIEALRDGNHSDQWGDILYDLWLATDKGPPIPIVSDELALAAFLRGDADADGDLDLGDLSRYVECASGPGGVGAEGCLCMDFNGGGDVDLRDFAGFQIAFPE
ncbi:MAG: hypothetical protein HOP29_12510 [Phycisphaerales bacterium]|nr:hypothetical protein [Phycisphaerales bacterium]